MKYPRPDFPPPPLSDILGSDHFISSSTDDRLAMVDKAFGEAEAYYGVEPEAEESLWDEKTKIERSILFDEFTGHVEASLPASLRTPENIAYLSNFGVQLFNETDGAMTDSRGFLKKTPGIAPPILRELSDNDIRQLTDDVIRDKKIPALLPSERARIEGRISSMGLDRFEGALVKSAMSLSDGNLSSAGLTPQDYDALVRPLSPGFNALRRLNEFEGGHAMTSWRVEQAGTPEGPRDLFSYRKKKSINGEKWQVNIGGTIIEKEFQDKPDWGDIRGMVRDNIDAAPDDDGDEVTLSTKQQIENIIGTKHGGAIRWMRRTAKNVAGMAAGTIGGAASGLSAAEKLGGRAWNFLGDDDFNSGDGIFGPIAAAFGGMAQKITSSEPPTQEDVELGPGWHLDGSLLADKVTDFGLVMAQLMAARNAPVAGFGLLASQAGSQTFNQVYQQGIRDGIDPELAMSRASFAGTIDGMVQGALTYGSGMVMIENLAASRAIREFTAGAFGLAKATPSAGAALARASGINVAGRLLADKASATLASIPGNFVVNLAANNAGRLASSVIQDIVTDSAHPLRPVLEGMAHNGSTAWDRIAESDLGAALQDDFFYSIMGSVVGAARSDRFIPPTVGTDVFGAPGRRRFQVLRGGSSSVIYNDDGRMLSFDSANDANGFASQLQRRNDIRDALMVDGPDGTRQFHHSVTNEARLAFEQFSGELDRMIESNLRHRNKPGTDDAIVTTPDIQSAIQEATRLARQFVLGESGANPASERKSFVDRLSDEYAESDGDWYAERSEFIRSFSDMRARQADDKLSPFETELDGINQLITTLKAGTPEHDAALARQAELVGDIKSAREKSKLPSSISAEEAADEFISTQKRISAKKHRERAEAQADIVFGVRPIRGGFGGSDVSFETPGQVKTPQLAGALNRRFSIRERFVDNPDGSQRAVYDVMFAPRTGEPSTKVEVEALVDSMTKQGSARDSADAIIRETSLNADRIVAELEGVLDGSIKIGEPSEMAVSQSDFFTKPEREAIGRGLELLRSGNDSGRDVLAPYVDRARGARGDNEPGASQNVSRESPALARYGDAARRGSVFDSASSRPVPAAEKTDNPAAAKVSARREVAGGMVSSARARKQTQSTEGSGGEPGLGARPAPRDPASPQDGGRPEGEWSQATKDAVDIQRKSTVPVWLSANNKKRPFTDGEIRQVAEDLGFDDGTSPLEIGRRLAKRFGREPVDGPEPEGLVSQIDDDGDLAALKARLGEVSLDEIISDAVVVDDSDPSLTEMIWNGEPVWRTGGLRNLRPGASEAGHTVIFSELADMAIGVIRSAGRFATFSSRAIGKWGRAISGALRKVWDAVSSRFVARPLRQAGRTEAVDGYDPIESDPVFGGAVRSVRGISEDSAIRREGLESQRRSDVAALRAAINDDFDGVRTAVKNGWASRLAGRNSAGTLIVMTDQMYAIHPKVGEAFRQVALEEYGFQSRAWQRASQFIGAYDKLSRADKRAVDSALLNSRWADAEAVFSSSGQASGFGDVREMLRGILADLRSVGVSVGDRGHDYFPRHVRDYRGMLEFLGSKKLDHYIDTILRREEVRRGYMTPDEQAIFLNNYIAQLSRGHRSPANANERVLASVAPDMERFYSPSRDSIINYIESSAKSFSSRKMFGRLREGGSPVLDGTLGKVLADVRGELSKADVDTIESIVDSVVRYRPLGKWAGTWREIGALAYLANEVNYSINLLDAITAIGRNGRFQLAPAARAIALGAAWFPVKITSILAKPFTGRSHHPSPRFRPEDFGVLSSLDADLRGKGILATIAGPYRDLIGDLGKITQSATLEGSMRRLSNEARNGSPELRRLLDLRSEYFGDASPGVKKTPSDVMADLVAGRMSEEVKDLVLRDLLDYSALHLTDHPKLYALNPKQNDGQSESVLLPRVLYYPLKTWAVRQVSAMRREGFVRMQNGDVGGGIKALFVAAMALAGQGAASSVIRQFMAGDEVDLDDATVDGLAGLIMLSQYQLDLAVSHKASDLFAYVNPGVGLAANMFGDAYGMARNGDGDGALKKMRSYIRRIPYIGRAAYRIYGLGEESSFDKSLGRRKDGYADLKKALRRSHDSALNEARAAGGESKIPLARRNELSKMRDIAYLVEEGEKRLEGYIKSRDYESADSMSESIKMMFSLDGNRARKIRQIHDLEKRRRGQND